MLKRLRRRYYQLLNLVYDVRQLWMIVKAVWRGQVVYSNGKNIYFPWDDTLTFDHGNRIITPFDPKIEEIQCKECLMVRLRHRRAFSLLAMKHDLKGYHQ
jgi:hypothetical protein